MYIHTQTAHTVQLIKTGRTLLAVTVCVSAQELESLGRTKSVLSMLPDTYIQYYTAVSSATSSTTVHTY